MLKILPEVTYQSTTPTTYTTKMKRMKISDVRIWDLGDVEMEDVSSLTGDESEEPEVVVVMPPELLLSDVNFVDTTLLKIDLEKDMDEESLAYSVDESVDENGSLLGLNLLSDDDESLAYSEDENGALEGGHGS